MMFRVALAAVAGMTAVAALGRAQSPKTLWDGVNWDEQSKRGALRPDILAFILSRNRFPAGVTESSQAEVLGSIKIVARK
jgi:hypothetical protein